MKTNTVLIMAAMVLIIAIAGLVSISHAAVISDVSMAGVGLFSTQTDLVDSTESTDSVMTTHTFGEAVALYMVHMDNVGMTKALNSSAGRITTSDTISSMGLIKGNTVSNEDTGCNTTPITFYSSLAGSTVTLQGAGSASSYGTVTPKLTEYGLSATGSGYLSQYALANSKSGVIETCAVAATDTTPASTSIKTSLLNEYRYSESNKIMGTFDVTTKYTYII